MTTTAINRGYAGRLNRTRGVVVGPGDFGSVTVRRNGEDRNTAWAPWHWMRESDGKVGRAK